MRRWSSRSRQWLCVPASSRNRAPTASYFWRRRHSAGLGEARAHGGPVRGLPVVRTASRGRRSAPTPFRWATRSTSGSPPPATMPRRPRRPRVDNFRVTSSGRRATSPPAVSITAPASGTTVTAPATVTLTATATDPENRMASVDFYAGSTMILRDTTAPYSASWSATTAGTYALTAVAHDADGGSTTSSAVRCHCVSRRRTARRP